MNDFSLGLIFVCVAMAPAWGLARSPERDVVTCDVKGKFGFIEYKPGEFRMVSDLATQASSPVSKDNVATVTTRIESGQCKVHVETLGVNGRPFVQNFSFPNREDGADDIKYHGPKNQIYDCIVDDRYASTLGQCKVPTKDNPGSRCENDEQGQLVPVSVEGATFDTEMSRIAVAPGGIQISFWTKEFTVHPYHEDTKKNAFLILRKGRSWCVDDTTHCNSFKGPSLMRNEDGEVIGVVDQRGQSIVLHQVKRPFSHDVYVVDGSKPALSFSVAEGKTTVTTRAPESGVGGLVTVVGDHSKYFAVSGREKIYYLENDTDVVSDCNGPHRAGGNPDSKKERRGQ